MSGADMTAGGAHEINRPVPWWRALPDLFGNLHQHRFILRTFVYRDLKIRYSESLLGYFWSLLEPLLLAATYYTLFALVTEEKVPRYSYFVVIGVLAWGFFTRCMNNSASSLTGNAGIIQSVYFPREIFAATATGSNLIITALSLLVTIPFMIYYERVPNINLLYVPLGLFLLALLGLGVGLGLACLNAVHRDVEHFLRFVTRAGFFLSPVMWTPEIAAGRSSHFYYLLINPVVVPMTMVRNGLDGRALSEQLSTGAIAYSVIFCVAAFLIGVTVFKSNEAEAVKYV
ncbi:MAG: ABC transporter permease [Deltaproteobacteria bacterium]|nr:ABC transporter permease [Deltaproteobacteria bacterium]